MSIRIPFKKYSSGGVFEIRRGVMDTAGAKQHEACKQRRSISQLPSLAGEGMTFCRPHLPGD